MNKLTSFFIGITIVFSALVAGPAAFAAPTTCEEIGETVYKGDPRYLAKLDKDADGRICEVAKIQLPVNGAPIPDGAPSNPYSPESPANPSTGHGDSNTPTKTDANGNPIQENTLANTGFNWLWVWAALGLLAAGFGVVRLVTIKK